MQLLCISVSHHNAPVEIRECLALPGEMIERSSLDHPIREGVYEMVLEMTILSTCNRLEIYAVVSFPESLDDEDQADRLLLGYIQEVFSIPTLRIQPWMRLYRGNQMVEHLFLVSAGLDSIALGETQILGQVSNALDIGLRSGYTRHVLSSLFRSAIHAGKRVRTETEIGRRPTSISTIAVQFAQQKIGPLAEKKILVVGLGKMGRLTVEVLREQGADQIILANRTFQPAQDLALKVGGSALPFEHLMDGFLEADLVITSTAATSPVIQPDMVAKVMSQRFEHPLMMIDLSVPRNIDPKVKEMDRVQVFDMDDLQAYVANAKMSSHHQLVCARKIVEQEAAEYEKLWNVMPFIADLHKKIEIIRQHEVEKTLKNIKNSDPQITSQIDLFSRALVRKILHEPTMHLRTETNQETLNDYVDVLARLFDLDESDTCLSF